mmetsp:Transcript_17489/g.37626  ORF Transcript_17489/g.37626 Transcript_17489/m.37626 type:complete len:205 (-) Transcript_17489:2774-3388(-)
MGSTSSVVHKTSTSPSQCGGSSFRSSTVGLGRRKVCQPECRASWSAARTVSTRPSMLVASTPCFGCDLLRKGSRTARSASEQSKFSFAPLSCRCHLSVRCSSSLSLMVHCVSVLTIHAVPVFLSFTSFSLSHLVLTPISSRKSRISRPSLPSLATSATSGGDEPPEPPLELVYTLASSAAATAVLRLLPPADEVSASTTSGLPS